MANGAQDGMADVAIVVISTNEAHWVEPCLESVFAHAGGAALQAIVVDNSSTDGTREMVESRFPQAQVVNSLNKGFAHGNNRGIEQANARYVLLLNPDTEVIDGTFAELVELMDARPRVGLAGVRQVRPDGTRSPTMRRFPSAARSFCEALYSEHWPIHPAWSGERMLEPEGYERETECDWTSGSFMLARREALLGAGLLEERFFLQSEEPDLCLRIKRAGWQVRHMPQMTIVHHAGKAGVVPRMVAQDAYSRKQYAHKHFSRVHRRLYVSALGLHHLVRTATASTDRANATARREGALLALRTLTGRVAPPFGPPPPTSVAPAVQTASAPPAAVSGDDPESEETEVISAIQPTPAETVGVAQP
jgi:N-acetylglucosaminyl-diphospho-decaprenol L-rhamnosyltransferase